MSIELYAHNQAAYESAVAMLSETGKAAIIHPTGTGKSFIGFELCEDNPEKTVCWLSPSEYIFQTQLENLRASGAEPPHNIKFYTYAKLMLMDNAQLAEIQPELCIYDEYHRGGAQEWQKGIQRFRAMYPHVKSLGLSATNIRYLDNQRNMADELFDGNIASEMTLGEAIVRGILNPPKYVTALFRYRDSLAKYEARVRGAKSKASRDEGERILEALRRALEKADGLDTIFQKHITEKNGKYLVFCANKEHMDEMVSHVHEWFGTIDAQPHIYTAYSDDPETSRAFNAFKQDESDHLKLLFCINMLNEGIHVADVDGVILFRPTVSPIIYKQQIGRALCADKKKNAVILDIVDNISALYSIGSIQEEMKAAITYYHYLGESEYIVNESFDVIDEVRDCRALFDALEGALSAPWDLMYQEAKAYAQENGNLEIPAKYRSESGYALGQWLFNQKQAYRGKLDKSLSPRQIKLLEDIGIHWESSADRFWDKNYEAARAYFEKYGHLNVPAKYVTADGLQLGIWVSRMRSAKADERSEFLTPERIQKLEAIGICWDTVSLQWEENFAECIAFYREHHHLNIPLRYVSPRGLRIGQWIVRMRSRYKSTDRGNRLTDEQIKRLNQLGMIWDTRQQKWETGYQHCLDYLHVHGNLRPPLTYQAEDGFKLGLWLEYRRRDYTSGKLDNWKIEKLESLGILWNTRQDIWMETYREVAAYVKAYGNLQISRNYRSPTGKALETWLRRQRSGRDSLTAEQRHLLDALENRKALPTAVEPAALAAENAQRL